MNKERIIYADILRIFAVFTVMVLHVAVSKWAIVDVTSFNWKVFNVYDSIVRFCIPVFIMLSGMFFLDSNKKIEYSDLFRKNIYRIFTAFIFWSAFYAVLSLFFRIFFEKTDMNLKYLLIIALKELILGHYHLWFLFTIIGLYLITPLLRKIVINDKKSTEYFLILFVFFTILLPTIFNVIPIVWELLQLSGFEDLKAFLNAFVSSFNFYFTLGFVGYFVLGHYLSTYDIKTRNRNLIYLFGIIGLLSTIIFTDIISMKQGKANGLLYGYLTPNVMIVSTSIFVLFKYEISKIRFSEKQLRFITTLSSFSFAMYLIHVFIQFILTKLGLTTLLFNPIFSVPIIAILLFGLSFLVCFILNKIPLLRKYIM